MLRILLLLVVVLNAHAATSDEVDPELRERLRAAASGEFGFLDAYEAEVWLTDKTQRMQRYVSDPREAQRIALSVHREARRAGLLPELVLAVIHTESLFDPFALSRAGAQGLMQVMPFWKKEIGRPGDNLMNIETNLRYGCAILKYYLDRENGNVVRALARYNGSLGKTWYPKRVLAAWDRHWE